MKKIRAVFGLIVVTASLFVVAPVFAGVNDFYFKDFVGDYYLSKDDDGISHLRVKESVTAVFPDFKQNKGICRQIPFTNQGGKNITLSDLMVKDIKVTRNGLKEPIYSIGKENDYYNVCTGTEDYVLGEQTYVFEYEFEKVVTEFDRDGLKYQELYWDTNGNGALQRFDSVTARVHFENLDVFAGDSWCYVGKYGESGQDRCSITRLPDGLEFSAKNLAKNENLTFDIELKAGSFIVPEPAKNYVYVFFMGVLILACVLFILYFFGKYLQTREKISYYKGLFVKPEYQPNDEYSLAELAEIYIGEKKDIKVALLLEMIVKKNVELKKVRDRKWEILVKTVSGLKEESIDLLAILNGGERPKDGDAIELKKHSADIRLVNLKKAMNSTILSDLKKDGLVENKYNITGYNAGGIKSILVATLIFGAVVLLVGAFALSFLESVFVDGTYGVEMVFGSDFHKVALTVIIITVVICVILNNATYKYACRTLKGLTASRYMDGLKLYIKMAEAERIKFLQGLKNVDVSAQGIVKLYEKLLPYAAIFGLEESWMHEMKKYCKVENISENESPDYWLNSIIVADLMRELRTASTYATVATTMSSSSGGSSSGFSGGGGGGFSGGGGGGGGFSGR